MKFTELNIKGAYIIELESHLDERGTFSRQFCKEEFKKHGIDFEICQCNVSTNYKKGTIRGLHYHKEPYLEQKIISCLRGKFFDVIVDLRKNSPTYLKWQSVELHENDNKLLYIPEKFAHGFQTLKDDTVIYYQLSNYFIPDCYAGLRWNDPKIAICWPDNKNIIINERDKNYELL